jgi:AI-2 transport system ATP-binding protein
MANSASGAANSLSTKTSDELNKLLSVRGVTKSFGSNAVLKQIDLDLNGGEVLALIGGNGAGKSTLMKIIMGIYQPDDGKIYVNGCLTHLTKASVALSAGIYMVPQEPMLFPNMTIEENITIGFQEGKAHLRARLKSVMEDIGWRFDLNRKASTLSIAEQTLVEIIRGLLRNAKILILDEPTSALTFDEVESFFRIVQELRQKGIGIIYITHRLSEVFDIATHVSIMRDGIITLHGPVADFNHEMLVQGLLPPGSVQKAAYQGAEAAIDYENAEPVFELAHVSGHGFNDISLKVYPGEIVGVAGVVGAGRTELVSTIFGRDKILQGKVFLNGKDITGYSTKKVLQAGINFVPEDRHNHGLFKISNITANTTSALLEDRRLGRFFLKPKVEQSITQEFVDSFRIKIAGQEQLAGSLSGGNQQKVVIGRSLSTKPKIVILDEPTRGIDAAARRDVYGIIRGLREQGVAILIISSDMEEIIELADRAVTVSQGSINAEFWKKDITQDNLTASSFGLHMEGEANAQ